MYQPSTGMDHLGLASVSQDRILPVLSPGVNVLTVHARYWSFYTWLLTEFWDRELPRTQASWGRFLKPRERIFVAAVLSCPRHGADIPEVGGKRRISSEIDAGSTEFDPNAPYLKNARGGYPIYASAISQLGLSVLERDLDQANCDAPTPTGRKVGLALREWVADTSYFVTYFEDTETAVPASVVDEYSKKICLCRLGEGPDRTLLQEAFLHGGDAAEANRRRASFRLILDLSAQTIDEPVEPWAFRRFVYYRAEDDGRTFKPSNDAVLRTARQWRLFQHRELLAWSWNRWLRQVNARGLDAGGDRAPLTLDEVLNLVDKADFDELATSLGLSAPGLTSHDPLTDLLEWVRSEGRIAGDLDAPWDLTAPACEDRILDVIWDLRPAGDLVTAGLLALVTACAARLWPLDYRLQYADDWHLVRAGGARRLSADRFLEDFRRHAKTGATICDAGRWFLEHYVLRQHHRVALGKLPDDTFRLRLDAGRVRFVDEHVAVEVNDPRYRALSTCAAELGWTAPMFDPNHKLSASGRRLVRDGDLPPVEPDVDDP
jgi:hypothetical protein